MGVHAERSKGLKCCYLKGPIVCPTSQIRLQPNNLAKCHKPPRAGQRVHQVQHDHRVRDGFVKVRHERHLGLVRPEGSHVLVAVCQARGEHNRPADGEGADAAGDEEAEGEAADGGDKALRTVLVTRILPRWRGKRGALTPMNPVPTVYRTSQSFFSAVRLHSAAFLAFSSYRSRRGIESADWERAKMLTMAMMRLSRLVGNAMLVDRGVRWEGVGMSMLVSRFSLRFVPLVIFDGLAAMLLSINA